jgi:hypothetical protein
VYYIHTFYVSLKSVPLRLPISPMTASCFNLVSLLNGAPGKWIGRGLIPWQPKLSGLNPITSHYGASKRLRARIP